MKFDFTRAAMTLMAVSFWSTGCSKAKFNETSAGSASAASCAAAALGKTSVPVKLIFVVDTSGSNSDNGLFDSLSTDPYKTLRGGSIQQFFSDYSSNSLFYWNFITFSNDAVKNYTGGFTNSSSVMQSAINMFDNEVDEGDTPYALALNAVANAIVSDTSASSGTKYIVVFLSDGYPYPNVASNVLASDISTIVNTKPGQVTFSTIYYGAQDATASATLQMMASAGNGHFLNVNSSASGKDFSIVNEITVPGTNCN